MEYKYKRLLSNSTWTVVGNAGSKILAFILLPFYTRWLGTCGYGHADLISTYSSLFLGLMSLCIADGIMIFIKGKTLELQKHYFSSLLNFSFILFFLWALIFIILSGIDSLTVQSSTFFKNIWVIFAMVGSIFLQNFTQQFAIGLDKIKLYSLTGVMLCLSTFVFSFVFIPRFGVNGYVWSIIVSHIITSLFCSVFTKAYRYYIFGFIKWNYIKEVLAYCIPLIPNAIMWWLVNALNRPLMEKHLSLSDIGIYAVSNKFPGVISMLYGVLSVALTVSIVEEYSKPTFSKFYAKIFHVLFFAITIASIILMCFSEKVIQIFAAPEFILAWKYMILLIVGSVFSCMSSYFGLPFTAAKKTKYFLYSSLWGAGVSTLLNFCLIPIMGLYGACIALVISFVVMAFSRYIYGLKFVKPRLTVSIIGYSMALLICSIAMIFIKVLIYRCIVAVLILSLIVYIEREHLSSILKIFKFSF